MSDDKNRRDMIAHSRMTGHPTVSDLSGWWCAVHKCKRARKPEAAR